jgi:predicted RNA polymerase sigma factor
VRKEKRECWQKFLKELIELLENNSRLEDTNRCWTVLRYISARLGSNTPAIKAANGTIAITIKEKEAVFLKSAFLGPIESLTDNLSISI